MQLTARLIPWSSVVGTGLMLLDESGRCIGQMALHNVSREIPSLVSQSEDRKTIMMEMAQAVADAINAPKNGPIGINNED